MNPRVTFVGYVEYRPGAFQPEFIIHGSDKLPDGAQVSADTLLRLGVKREPSSIPSYWEWTRERFMGMLRARLLIRQVTYGL